MPEEINRLLVDRIANLLFTPSEDADVNLLREGVDPTKIVRVGNVMIDSLVRMLPNARKRDVLQRLELTPKQYVVMTLHRPCNVDYADKLRAILAFASRLASDYPVAFSVHPRTSKCIKELGLMNCSPQVRFLDPMNYIDFLGLLDAAGAVLTDSGGIQEETTYLGVPCYTLRQNTERPITIHCGTNELLSGRLEDHIPAIIERIRSGPLKVCPLPLWDGKASMRIAQYMRQKAIDELRHH